MSNTLSTYYFTFGSGQKYAPGYYEIQAKDHVEARKMMHKKVNNKWSFVYDNLDDIHPNDRIKKNTQVDSQPIGKTYKIINVDESLLEEREFGPKIEDIGKFVVAVDVSHYQLEQDGEIFDIHVCQVIDEDRVLELADYEITEVKLDEKK